MTSTDAISRTLTITAHSAEAALSAFAGPTPALWVDVSRTIITGGWRDDDDAWDVLRDAVAVGVEAARVALAPSRASVEADRIEYESTAGTIVSAVPGEDGAITVTITGAPGSVLRRAVSVQDRQRWTTNPPGWSLTVAELTAAAAEQEAAYWRAMADAYRTRRPC